ncbi:hypothetical protein KIL84_020327 [Mauremys mutica]|uniref:Secreted protein n=1 Tax=Mauremys mutica TaxID=74926 RepID=A0A9D3XWK8_9SAUR|nr:hypothetical protein KIL84_020327 [Mauremys mutica]
MLPWRLVPTLVLPPVSCCSPSWCPIGTLTCSALAPESGHPCPVSCTRLERGTHRLELDKGCLRPRDEQRAPLPSSTMHSTKTGCRSTEGMAEPPPPSCLS